MAESQEDRLRERINGLDFSGRRGPPKTAVSRIQYGDTYVDGASNFVVVGDIYMIKEPDNEYEVRKYKEILHKLPSLDFDVKYEAAHDTCMPGTGRWFLDSVEFEAWLGRLGQVLWSPGIPGAGKTCMSAIVIKHLQDLFQKDATVAVGYVYFDYGNRDRLTPAAVFGNLLRQIVEKQSNLSSAFLNQYQDFTLTRKNWREQEYLALLTIAIRSYQQVLIVVDALDECAEKDRNRIVAGLRNIGPQVNILVTSRFVGDITQLFQDEPKLEILATDVDMATYVRNEIAQDQDLSDLVEDDKDLEDTIIRSLVERARNMFLLVRLHVQSLSSMLSKNDVLEALEVLPRELGSTYTRALERIREQVDSMRKLGLNVLTWLLTTRRPLSLVELQHALSIKPGQSQFQKDNLIRNVHKLASSCCGLVVMDQKANTIRLVHYTTAEYLEQHREQIDAHPHLSLARTCLTYLGFADFADWSERDDLIERHPFLAYAGRYWGWHYQQGLVLDRDQALTKDLGKMSLKLLLRRSRCTDTFIIDPPQGSPDSDPHRWFINRRNPRGIHIASHFGLVDVLQMLIRQGSRNDCRDASGNTPLHYAAWTGQSEVVATLINAGADVMSRKEHLLSVPLQYAAINGQVRAMTLLIEHGAHVNYDPSGPHSSMPPLHEAIRFGQYDAAKCLVAAGADVNLRSAQGKETPLQNACGRMQVQTIALLLQNGVSLDGPNSHLALSSFLRRGYEDANLSHVQALAALVSHNVDLNCVLEYGHRILDCELRYGRGQNIEILLNAGASPELQWNKEQPAVLRWVQEPWFPKLVDICVQSEPDANPELDLPQTQCTRTREVEAVFRQPQGTHMWSLYYHVPRPLSMPGGIQDTDQAVFQRVKPYLSLQVPEDMIRVTKIVITTESHDQGYTSQDHHANGTYGLSYTWFDLLFMYHKHPEHPIWEDMVQLNVNARSEWKTHVNTWDAQNFNKADGRAWVRADAIWSLRPGDHVLLYARAFFPGWENHVKRAEICLEGPRRKPTT